MSMSNADRHFIIARQGMSIVIREVADECALTFCKTAAWDLARRMAKPAKSAKDPRAKAANQIEVIGLDGMSTVVQTIEATQDAYEAELRGEKPAPVAKPAPTATPEANAVEVPEYTWLRAWTGENGFLNSVKDQLAARGKLSEKQTDAVRKCMENVEGRRADRKAAEAPKNNVPAGRYAVENEDGELRFYKVDQPTEGRWAGYTFLKVMASDTEYPVKGAAKHAIIAKIAVDARAAMVRYGQEIGKCGHCNRTLTDEASRAAGIGPICAEKM